MEEGVLTPVTYTTAEKEINRRDRKQLTFKNV